MTPVTPRKGLCYGFINEIDTMEKAGGYQSWLEEFARFLQEKETVTGDKCMALLEEQKRKSPPAGGNRRVGILLRPKSP